MPIALSVHTREEKNNRAARRLRFDPLCSLQGGVGVQSQRERSASGNKGGWKLEREKCRLREFKLDGRPEIWRIKTNQLPPERGWFNPSGLAPSGENLLQEGRNEILMTRKSIQKSPEVTQTYSSAKRNRMKPRGRKAEPQGKLEMMGGRESVAPIRRQWQTLASSVKSWPNIGLFFPPTTRTKTSRPSNALLPSFIDATALPKPFKRGSKLHHVGFSAVGSQPYTTNLASSTHFKWCSDDVEQTVFESFREVLYLLSEVYRCIYVREFI
ncbi:hypothetical protein B0H16DRAFT_1472664 [Mycena metata]|uniref:Uncharacterized protein n=1 Tax=Mycena metata TaxID=1033252 RepID=A0AAD7HND0_9AGAR|nr:hypothetical protein B0H16DRAFT_1472664 [Mycena metata]